MRKFSIQALEPKTGLAVSLSSLPSSVPEKVKELTNLCLCRFGSGFGKDPGEAKKSGARLGQEVRLFIALKTNVSPNPGHGDNILLSQTLKLDESVLNNEVLDVRAVQRLKQRATI